MGNKLSNEKQEQKDRQMRNQQLQNEKLLLQNKKNEQEMIKRLGQKLELEQEMRILREQEMKIQREQEIPQDKIDLSFSYKIFKYMTLSSYKNYDESVLLSNEDDDFKLICNNFNDTLEKIEKDEDTVYSSYYDKYKEKFTNVDNNKDLFMVNLSTILNKLRDDYLNNFEISLIINILSYPNDINKINYETFKDYNTITFNNGVKDEVIKYDLSAFKTKDISPLTILPLLYEIFISFYINDKKDNFTITLSNETPVTPETPVTGGKKINKKEILGKVRCIYKKTGDRKEYIKHKGELITVSEYKKMMRDKKKNVVNIKPKAKSKPKASHK